MRTKNIIGFAVVLLIGGIIGWWAKPSADHLHSDTQVSVSTEWTCSMHPQIRTEEPGQCPICGMDLIPAGSTSGNEHAGLVSLSPTAMQLASVRTEEVGGSEGTQVLRLNGVIRPDERLQRAQTAHFPGRMESLSVDFTGEFVTEGTELARVYSPELVVAQTELREAAQWKSTQPELYRAARAKLSNWKLSEAQIDAIESGNVTLDAFPVRANTSGFVTAKRVVEGDYVTRGQTLYQITGLSTVWVILDVYEEHLGAISSGDTVEFTVKSFPGERFEGVIDYIDPLLDPLTRVAKARVVMSNPNLAFRPGMLVTASVRIARESIGITIPASAVLWTGERSLVYVEQATDKGGLYEPREITLGPRVNDRYAVVEGLADGERVVVNGTFSVDAAAQLAGVKSMMSGAEDREELPTATQTKLEKLTSAYLAWKNALVEDNAEAGYRALEDYASALSAIAMSDFPGETHQPWMNVANRLKVGEELPENLEGQRTLFLPVSEGLVALFRAFDFQNSPLYIQHCPMADEDRGADWLSASREVLNPYFGSSMLRCGEVVPR